MANLKRIDVQMGTKWQPTHYIKFPNNKKIAVMLDYNDILWTKSEFNSMGDISYTLITYTEDKRLKKDEYYIELQGKYINADLIKYKKNNKKK